MKALFEQIKIRHKFKWVTFGVVNDTHVCLEQCADKKKTVHDLAASLPEGDCRYVVFEHAYATPDGRPQEKLYFICWFPRAVNPTQKMLYSTARTSIRAATPGCVEISAGTKGELLDGVLKTVAKRDDDEASDAGDDWMDD